MSQEDDLKGQLQRTLTAPLGGEDTAQLSNRTLTGGEIEGWVPGTHLGGQYRLIDLLGDGGMGAVYLARDVLLGRRVAIKSLRPPDSIAHDPRARAEYIQMFQRDATSTARLNHPNIVTIHNTGVHEGIPFMVLEYLEGESLDEILERGALGEEEATRVAGTLARALAYAHERGVIHRDIKPANIFITKQGQVKLLDFGVALLQMSKIVAAEDADITAEELRARIGQGSTVAGTPAYMAPEQLIGDMQDHRVDIWALGVVLFEMITGARPSLSTNHTVHGRLDFTPLEPFHEETQQIVRACLQRSAQLRVGTAASLARRLEQATMRLTAPNPSVQLPHNKTLLPEVHGEFLGRDVELEELLEHFAHPSTPLLTVTGAPGVGKSRLALEIAHRASSIFTLTAHLDLHDCESLLAVPAALARTFGYTSMEQGRGIFQQLDLLLETTERVLFVLDGLREDATWGSELLEFFIEHERKPELLVTSRRPLRIRGEAVYLLTPLQLPTHEDDGDALRLYYAMLPATTAHLLDSKSERESARALVRHLDGLPIAIELAAKRAEMLPPAAMLDRIDRPFDLLRPPASAHDARALEEIFEDAWERLSHAEKVALASASLFHGSFSLEAAEVVIGELDQLDPAPFVLDLCEELVNRSMLVEREMPSGALQFEMLGLLQTFVRQKQREVLDGFARQDARIRHAEHFASGEDFLDVETLDERHDLLDANRANLHAALETAMDELDPDWSAALILLLGEVCLERGALEQVRGALERSSHLLQRSSPQLQVELDLLRAQLALATSEREEAHSFATNALTSCARGKVQDRRGELSASAQVLLARAARHQGMQDMASALLERARADATGASIIEVDVLQQRAEIAMDAHDFDRATSLARQARERAEELGSRRRVALASSLLARHRWRLGEIRRARAIYQEILAPAIRAMRDDLEVIAHCGLGELALFEDELDVARVHLERVKSLHEGFEDERTELIEGCLGVLAHREGSQDRALAHVRRALMLATRRDEPCAIARWRALEADICFGLGERERAEEQWRSVLEDTPPLLLGSARELYWNIRVNMARQYHLASESERAWQLIGEVVQEIEEASVTAGPQLAHALRLASTSFG